MSSMRPVTPSTASASVHRLARWWPVTGKAAPTSGTTYAAWRCGAHRPRASGTAHTAPSFMGLLPRWSRSKQKKRRGNGKRPRSSKRRLQHAQKGATRKRRAQSTRRNHLRNHFVGACVSGDNPWACIYIFQRPCWLLWRRLIERILLM